MNKHCGFGGCCGATNRRRGKATRGRICQQPAITWDDQGNGWCYYHNPSKPKQFGEGYLSYRREGHR